jgi:opacity protein-like surface antigen
MKKALVVLSVLALLAMVSTSAFAERWGKPGANLAKGQWSLGLEYNYIEETLDFSVPSGVSPLLPLNGEHQAVRNQLLVRAGYGLTDQLEGFIKMGGTSTDINEAFVSGGGDQGLGSLEFNQDLVGNMEFTIVGGLAYTILQQGDFRLGAVGQFSYFETNDTGEARVYPGMTINQGIDANVFKFEGALLASYTLGKFTPYGGICMLISDSDARYRAYDSSVRPYALLDINLDQEEWFGGVCGLSCAVTDNVRIGIEMTGVSEGVGLSTGVTIAL